MKPARKRRQTDDLPDLPRGLSRGSLDELERALAAGGVVPPGRYRLRRSLIAREPVELDGAGAVVLLAPKGVTPALRLEAGGVVRGLAVRVADGTAIELPGGSLSLERSVIVGDAAEEGRYGVHATGRARLTVRRCRFRGFRSQIDGAGEAVLDVAEVSFEGGAQGLCCEETACATVIRSQGARQTEGSFIANDRSRIEVTSSSSQRPKLVGFYADGRATLIARDCTCSGSGMAGFYAGGNGCLELEEVVTERCRDTGLKAANAGRLRAIGWRGSRDRWGAMARDEGTVVIEGGAVAATCENAVLCCGASVTCAGLLVQRVTWPAAAVTRGLLVVEGCDFEDTKIALLARGEESALEARGCSAEHVDYGAQSCDQGRISIVGCAFSDVDEETFYEEDGGRIDHADCTIDDEPAEEAEDLAPEPVEARPRERLGEVVVPSGLLAIVDFSLLREHSTKHTASLRRAVRKRGFGYAEGPHGIILGVAVPAGAYTVWGTRMAAEPFPELWRTVDLDLAAHLPVVSRERIGALIVDGARFMFADAEALSGWKEDVSRDGLADVCFWGKDEEALAEASGAAFQQRHHNHGWIDLPLADAAARFSSLGELVQAHDWWVVGEVRPHDTHFHLLVSIQGDGAGSVAIGEAKLCGMFTSWGDGVFPIWRELAEEGTLVRVRVALGTPTAVRNLKIVNDL